ncbi:MAG: hypothetical protein OES46_17685 [Gammaproteobacteria bacterium]|jgi:hypothetical protein|nr:hypothetical protein [Gammaproteobacteria bacterium]
MSQQQAVLRAQATGSLIASGRKRRNPSLRNFLLVCALLGTASWWFAINYDYKPGSDLGYNLGLVGGVAMLFTLLYTAAKRIRFLYAWINMKQWFYAHMVLGIVGPVLILLHSKFILQSINGQLAFWSMWLVFFSGITGRYLHTKICHDLQSRRAALLALKQKMGISTEDVRSKFHFAPLINEHLDQFEASVLIPSKGLWLNLWHFLTLPFRFERTYLSACRHLKRAIKKRAQKRGWDSRKTRKRLAYGKKITRTYLEAVRSVARSSAYAQLFSLWHLVHIPLLFWLAISGAFHVLAVHMY